MFDHFKVVALTTNDYERVLKWVVSLGLVSGVIYDALHVVAAERAGAERILTFNLRHVLRVADAASRSLIQEP